MGQEIDSCFFQKEDFEEFARRLEEETAILKDMFRDGAFDDSKPVAGYELETWLLDSNALPSCSNGEFLSRLNDPEIVPELAQFNIELNGPPRRLTGNALSLIEKDIERSWNACSAHCEEMDLSILAIGTLPTLKNSDLGLSSMSSLKRYTALNEQVLKLRNGNSIKLDIEGRDKLQLEHHDVMLEAAATSFQLHLQLDVDKAAHYYNLSKIISAPMMAVSSNSPFLFGRELWEESRIPLFEQAVAVGGTDYCRRVTFGIRYIKESLFEVFEANQQRYPVLLPLIMDSKPEELKHLSLHNGTIWRWTRPLVGFNESHANVRIEHRTIPAGPTQLDQMANMAFFFGLITAMAEDGDWEQRIPHENSLKNFYKAAKYGMNTQVIWENGRKANLKEICLSRLIPLAEKGLELLEIDSEEAEKYLYIIKKRLGSGRTGSYWQRKWMEKYGRDWKRLTLAYQANQLTNRPVHTWDI